MTPQQAMERAIDALMAAEQAAAGAGLLSENAGTERPGPLWYGSLIDRAPVRMAHYAQCASDSMGGGNQRATELYQRLADAWAQIEAIPPVTLW